MTSDRKEAVSVGSPTAGVVLGSAEVATCDGLATLGPDATALLESLDRLFVSWAEQGGGREIFLPPLLDVDDLETIDYFVNFPHLGLATSGLQVAAADVDVDGLGHPSGAFPPDALEGAARFLPSAACYGLYFAVRGSELDVPVVRTVRSQCFRREERYDGLQRLLGFRMREIVYLGTAEGARDHLEAFRERIERLLQALGVPFDVQAAQDPFYDKRSSRALLQKLDPVKHEFVAYGETAIASVNVHRNFFGERCEIRSVDDGTPIHTSCVAFGLERWVWALSTRFDGDLGAAAAAVAALA